MQPHATPKKDRKVGNETDSGNIIYTILETLFYLFGGLVSIYTNYI